MPKELWNTIPEEVRAFIRNNRTPNPRSNGDNQHRGRRGASNSSNGQQRVNFHDQDNKDNDTDSFSYVREDNGEREQPLSDTPSDTSSFAALLSLIKEHATPHMASVPLDSAIRQLMANTHQSSNSSADNAKKSVVIDGKRFVKIKVHRIQYRFSEAAADNHRLGESSLVDRGANGGLAGEDICVIEHTLRKADISGINNHTVVGLPIVTAAGVVQTLAGPVSLILHQYALIGKGKSIHSRCKWNVMTSW